MCLSDKRQEFVNQYFKCGFNATEAARRAGYKHPNKYGPKLTHNDEVSAEIKRRMDELTLTADQVVYLLSCQATANAIDYIDEFGIIDWQKLKKSDVQVKKMAHQKGQKSMFELPDSQSALALLGKYHKLFTDRIIQEHKGKVELEHTVDLSKLSDEQLNNLAAIITSIT